MLRRLLPLVFVTLGLTTPMASVAAQPFTQGAAASAISAANALSARIRSYHRWQGLTPPPASYCATMREGEAVLKQLDEEEEVNSQSGISYTLYPCPVPAPYPPRAPVLRILDAKAPACRRRADVLRVSFDARRSLMQKCLRIPGT